MGAKREKPENLRSDPKGCQFGSYNVQTNVVAGPDNQINIPNGNGRAYVQGGNKGNWPQDRPEWTAAHEAGHLMGIDDRYDYSTNKPKNPKWSGTIMAERGGVPHSQDVIDILNSPKNKTTSGPEPGGIQPCP